jgi:hypothetical protein
MIIDNLQQIIDINCRTICLYPVFKDERLHSVANSIIGLTLIDCDTEKTYTLPINHAESSNKFNNLDFLKGKKVYCYNVSALRYAGYDTTDFIDIKMQYYLRYGKIPEQDTPSIFQHYNRHFHNFYSVGSLVSLIKHEEVALDLHKVLWIEELQPGIDFYQNKLISSFVSIERNGLCTDENLFNTRFGQTLSKQHNHAFTEYNFYTTTGRPSNRFGGINFAALNKDDGSRDCFISRYKNGTLLELDFNAYHPRLIASLIDYDFGTDNVYEHLAKHYNNTQTPTKDQIETAKEDTFRQIYGGIRKEYMHIPFFSKTNDLAQMLWEEAKTKGYIESPISGRRLLLANYQDITCYTLFNYFIQMYETESNVLILENIHKRLTHKEAKIILYTYDSMLFDVHPNEVSFVLDDLIPNTIDLKQFPIKIKTGINYGNISV